MNEERELTEFERKVRDKWKEAWQGTETYANMLVYLSFLFAGFGIGVIYMTNEFLIILRYAPEGIGYVVRRALVVAMAGFVGCHVIVMLLDYKYGDD